jgi:DNA-binding IclR family transcriptional regulator
MLAIDPSQLGVSEIARRLRIPKSSTHMLLATLEGRGYVVSDDARRFRLHPSFRGEPRTWVGGARVARLLPLARAAMQRLTEITRETSFLGVRRDERHFQCIEKRVPVRDGAFDMDLGGPRPLHAGSIGLILLAFEPPDRTERLLRSTALARVTTRTICEPEHLRLVLADVRTQGFAIVRDSGIIGASSVAAPIFDANGAVIAGMTVTSPSARFDAILDDAKAELLDTTTLLSEELALADAATV